MLLLVRVYIYTKARHPSVETGLSGYGGVGGGMKIRPLWRHKRRSPNLRGGCFADDDGEWKRLSWKNRPSRNMPEAVPDEGPMDDLR